MKKLSICLTVLLSAFIFQACSPKGGRSLDELRVTDKSTPKYTINRGDTLNVQVWGEPKVSGQFLVRNDGRISMPLISEVDAAGKTLDQLSNHIANKLSEWIKAASVSASVAHRSPTAYYLSGNFQKPGEYRSDKEIKLLQAVATGGGFGPFADESNIILIRQNPTKGGDLRYHLNYDKVVSGSQPNPALIDGDTLTVK